MPRWMNGRERSGWGKGGEGIEFCFGGMKNEGSYGEGEKREMELM